MVRQVNHSNLAHVLDTGQYCGSLGASGATPESAQRYELYKSIEQTAPLAVFVRAKIYRIETGEEEWLDYPYIFSILNRVGYNGWVSIVYEGQEDEETALPKAVKYLRRFM